MKVIYHHGLSASKAPDSPIYAIQRLDGRGPTLATARRIPAGKRRHTWNLVRRGELMGSFDTLRAAMRYLTHSITGRASGDCRFCEAGS